MKRILIVAPDFYPKNTGFANATLNLVKSIHTHLNSDIEVYILTETQNAKLPELNVYNRVYRFARKGKSKISKLLFEFKRIILFNKIIKEKSIDYVLFETNTTAYLQFFSIKKFLDRTIVRIHSTADTEVVIFNKFNSFGLNFHNGLIKYFMKKVRYILSTSNYYLKFIQKYYLKENIYDIWNFKKYGLLFNSSESLLINDNPPVKNQFITMGKLSDNGLIQKGFEDLIYSISALNRGDLLPRDFKLIMIGDGPKYDYVAKIISNLKLNDFIHQIRVTTHKETLELLNTSQIAILTSRYEGQSMFLTEAISLGKPIIGTSSTGMEELIQDSYNGFLAESGNIISISEKINNIINLPQKDLQNMSINSKLLFEKKFSYSATAKQLSDFLLMIDN